jgi:outer membrane receptor protein involved in Fe transport
MEGITMNAVNLSRRACLARVSLIALAMAAGGQVAHAQEAQDTASSEQAFAEIIVTARKQSEAINDVPMSISAATGETLESRGVSAVEDLAKIVPTLSNQVGTYGNQNYNIRGIGNLSDSIASSPTVAIYVDQAPLAFSNQAQGLTYDLARVEVLKGPQGTLFGQNATGGLVNFVPNAPGREFDVGLRATYGSFNTLNFDGFANIPISDTLAVRIAGLVETGDGWQKSISRPSDRLGKRDFWAGRVMVKWEPADTVRFLLNLNGFQNRSESQAPQYAGFFPASTTGAPRVKPNFDAVDALYATLNLKDNRLADWVDGVQLENDADQYQIALRSEFDLSDSITLTSLTNYVNYDQHLTIDTQGVPFVSLISRVPGTIETFSQELRLSGKIGASTKWMIGGSYQHDIVHSGTDASGNLSNAILPSFTVDSFYGRINAGLPPLPVGFVTGFSTDPNYIGFSTIENHNVRTLGIFGSLDQDLTDTLSLQLSARYTDSRNRFSGCFKDSGDGRLAAAAAGLPNFPNNTAAGQCNTALDNGVPGFGNIANFVPATVGLAQFNLNDTNVAWRAGLNWQPHKGTLLYANVTRGYKAGAFPRVPALDKVQLTPAPQEQLTAYEVGFKQTIGRIAQVNAAAFYYDYKDKQTVGNFVSVFAGNLPAAVSIPKSRAYGFEMDATVRPIEGLTATVGGAYLDTKIISSQLNGVDGVPQAAIDPLTNSTYSLTGLTFPTTSKWSWTADVEYRLPLGSDSALYLGASPRYRSSFITVLSSSPLVKVPGYTLLDLRAGVELQDGRWRIEAWGRNVTDKYYLVNISRTGDGLARLTGRPATFGVTVAFKHR